MKNVNKILNLKNNNKESVTKSAFKTTCKIVLIFCVVVAILSFGIYNFLQVPEIVNILQTQPADQWIKSLFHLDVMQAAILGCIFIAIKLILFILPKLGWVFAGVFLWKLISLGINKLITNLEDDKNGGE